MVIAGPVLYPLEKSAEAMAFYRNFLADSPDDVYAVFAFLTVPPGPPFPEHLHLQEGVRLYLGLHRRPRGSGRGVAAGAGVPGTVLPPR